jgi:hypothetical protein
MGRCRSRTRTVLCPGTGQCRRRHQSAWRSAEDCLYSLVVGSRWATARRDAALDPRNSPSSRKPSCVSISTKPPRPGILPGARVTRIAVRSDHGSLI